MPPHLRPHIDVISARKAVTPAFVSSATPEQEINKIKNKQNTLGCITRGHLSLIDGAVYLSILLNNFLNFEDTHANGRKYVVY